MSCNNYKKSSIVASVYNQNVAENGTISFTTVRTTGTAITMNAANNAILLNKAGLYQVNVSASVTPATDAESCTIQLNRAGVAMIDGMSTLTFPTAAGSTGTMSFSTEVNVDTTNPGQGSANIALTLTNTGQECTYNNVIVNVIKEA